MPDSSWVRRHRHFPIRAGQLRMVAEVHQDGGLLNAQFCWLSYSQNHSFLHWKETCSGIREHNDSSAQLCAWIPGVSFTLQCLNLMEHLWGIPHGSKQNTQHLGIHRWQCKTGPENWVRIVLFKFMKNFQGVLNKSNVFAQWALFKNYN